MEFLKRVSLPLLAKEMVELGCRPRTYLVRTLYAVFVLLICWIVLRTWIPWTITSVLNVLGSGRLVLRSLDVLQNIGLQFVLPALACGVFTIEKERNTLSLLFLTRLGPWAIIFEKVCSRLLLAGSFLLISLPVLAFGYALGGITTDQMFSDVLSWITTSIVIVCASTLCSAYCRTSSSALMLSYLLVLLTRLAFLSVISGVFGNVPMFMILLFLIPGMSGLTGAATLAPAGTSLVLATAATSIPWLIASGLYLLAARWFLVRRAFLSQENRTRRLLDRLDSIDVTSIFRRGKRSPQEAKQVAEPVRNTIPDNQPVAWRELHSRGIGKLRYQALLLIVLEGPVLGYAWYLWLFSNQIAIQEFAMAIEVIMWLVLGIVCCVVSAGLICGERDKQTLDVLLTTPMTGSEIVLQKMAGIFRLIWVLEAPLWTCLLFRWLAGSELVLVICHTALLLIYPRCIAWSSMWFGLTSRTTLSAVVKSLLTLVWKVLGTMIVGWFLIILCLNWIGFGFEVEQFVVNIFAIPAHISPLPLFIVSEFKAHQRQQPHMPLGMRAENAVVLFSVIQLTLLLWTRTRCLRTADALLNRARGWPRHLGEFIARIRAGRLMSAP